MTLRDVTSLDQLQDYYAAKELHTDEEKIEHLMNVMGVQAVRGDNVLGVLEGAVIVGRWKDFHSS